MVSYATSYCGANRPVAPVGIGRLVIFAFERMAHGRGQGQSWERVINRRLASSLVFIWRQDEEFHSRKRELARDLVDHVHLTVVFPWLK
jgi:hypothetical protein